MRNLFLTALLVLSGCALNSNDPIATFKAVGAQYEVKLTGRRENMAHDPISFLFRGSSSSSMHLLLPRITGEVLGEEIPVKNGYYSYQGKIQFTGEFMLVDLLVNNTDQNKLQSTLWNGKYVLKEVQ